MPAPIVPDAPDVTFIHWLVGAIGGMVGAVASALFFVWHAASRAAEMRKDITQGVADVLDLRKRFEGHVIDLKDLRSDSDRRHEDNIRSLATLSNVVAALPDKHDFQRLEDQLEKSLRKIEAAVAQAR